MVAVAEMPVVAIVAVVTVVRAEAVVVVVAVAVVVAVVAVIRATAEQSSCTKIESTWHLSFISSYLPTSESS